MERMLELVDQTLEKNTNVVITGTGIISSIGYNTEEFTDSLKSGRSGIDFLQNPPENVAAVQIGAQIRDFSFDKLIKQCAFSTELANRARLCARRSPFSVQCSVLAALEAWEKARLDTHPVADERKGVVISGSNLSQNYLYSLHNKFEKAPEYMTPSYALHFMDTDHVGTISDIFQIKGEGFTVGGASASGNVAIIKAMQLIQQGLVDVCIVMGTLADFSPMEFMSFSNLGAIGGKSFGSEPDKACRPFDQKHEGFIYGQAAACLVLESSQSAEKRGVQPLAELLSGVLVLDGNRLSDPNEDGEVRSMELALHQAGVSPNDIDYINAHGTSTPSGDLTEIKAIKRLFKERLGEIWINSTKSLSGHCLYSAGIVEALSTIIQMKEGFVHPNLNLEDPIDQECRFSRGMSVEARIRTSLSNSFGFGGINTSIVLRGINQRGI
ncbi:polyketide beta-ketoacyl:ACP synthase [Paenibacillus sp. HN-1]|uniref:beta-ketoacyl synthase N-terminal-like domain-containing protein n=1 Tax=Paenibacillus TaxID=44249 RepID=UPI001CA9F963|nr:MULTISPECIES: beta-ketoacyl synthase N-terminal-like domain-containing protein [Paenibacillus]MBY9081318.1 polyketide beta-ketoacyl:ACP synthase [Paenibacillus sp. CGMCC 1.18879]MBY9086497.1 polyketide beta-ketoacyl:ACP synthase [Paenibacillus sinensis]